MLRVVVGVVRVPVVVLLSYFLLVFPDLWSMGAVDADRGRMCECAGDCPVDVPDAYLEGLFASWGVAGGICSRVGRWGGACGG